MLRDFHHPLRILGRNPSLTIVAVLAIALGIGANTALFSVVHAVLLRPLAFAEPQRLVLVWEILRDQNRFQNVVSKIDGGIPLDSAIESQQFRSHRRSAF